MPYEWSTSTDRNVLQAWPYRSLSKRDFHRFILISCALFLFPLLAVVGSTVLWVLLGFFAITVVAIIYAIQRSFRDGQILETLTLTKDVATLVHRPKTGPTLTWNAQTYWVELGLEKEAGPVKNYITLRGNGRTVELGSFLSEEERAQLYAELQQKFSDLKTT